MSGLGSENKLAETFAEIARELLSEPDVQHTLDRMCALVVATVNGCNHADVTLLQGRRLQSAAANDEVGPAIDSIQIEVGDGPCLEAVRGDVALKVDNLATEKRWPEFSMRAAESTGVRSLLAFRLFVNGDTMGALNLFSKHAGAFNDESLAIGAIFSVHAAVALRAAQAKEELALIKQAVRARDMVAQAKGILMARQGVTSEAAFDLLRRGSQRLNIKLQELARRVVEDERDGQGS